jgi:hypothetical protein
MVSATATPQQQVPPQQPQRQPPSDHELTGAIVAALGVYFTAEALTRALRAPFKAAGIGGAALAAVASLVASWPHEAMEGTGPATRWAVRTNLTRRASFFLAAAKRVQQAVTAARSQGEPLGNAARDALGDERRFMSQHIAASTGRIQAASAVDGMVAMHGNLVGWQAVKDKRCTPGCADASGKNFRADQPPIVEGHPALPGAVHGATCRCRPVPPFRDAPVMD